MIIPVYWLRAGLRRMALRNLSSGALSNESVEICTNDGFATTKSTKDIDKHITTMKTNSSEDELIESSYDLSSQRFYHALRAI
jgi:hypothetical protein